MRRRRRLLLNHTYQSYLLLGVFIIGVIIVVQVLKPYHIIPDTVASPDEALQHVVAPVVGSNRNLESRVSSNWEDASVTFYVDDLREPNALRSFVLSVVCQTAPDIAQKLPYVQNISYSAFINRRNANGQSCKRLVAQVQVRRRMAERIGRERIGPEGLTKIADRIEWDPEFQP